MDDKGQQEVVNGYEIIRAVTFDNDRGFALAENPAAVAPFVTWQFTEESGQRDYYWGHYAADKDAATRDFESRVDEYQKDYSVLERVSLPAPEIESYKYYSTQRPVDIGTFPKTEGGPHTIENYDSRTAVEHGRFMAWGFLEYSVPLTSKQVDDYELRPALINPDRRRLEEQAQTVGKWEQAHRVPDAQRLTWWYPDFGSFVVKEFVTPEQLAKRHGQIAEKQAAPKRISEQMAEAQKQVERGGGSLPKKHNKSHEDR